MGGPQRLDRARWAALCARVGAEGATPRFEELEQAYAERHRHYHTAQHIAECLGVFDEVRDVCERPDEVELAIWLHDAVYRPRRSDNEERSAVLAETWLSEAGLDAAAARRVGDLVRATRHVEAPRTPDEAALVDVDLHVLGADPERFDEYESQVRAEYRWVPGPLFRRRRAEILEGFLGRDPLYGTAPVRSRFEERARANLERALARLAR